MRFGDDGQNFSWKFLKLLGLSLSRASRPAKVGFIKMNITKSACTYCLKYENLFNPYQGSLISAGSFSLDAFDRVKHRSHSLSLEKPLILSKKQMPRCLSSIQRENFRLLKMVSFVTVFVRFRPTFLIEYK